MIRNIHSFVDEFGDTNIHTEVEGVSDTFIMTAVLVEDATLPGLRDSAARLRDRYFQTGEMKSSTVGSNDRRRLKLLTETVDLEFKYYAFVVKKGALYRGKGLAFKRSFFKNLYKRLYERIYRIFQDVSVVADEHGSIEFMRGFEGYLNRQLKPDLFSRWSFRFQDSKTEVLLQLADFLSGTLARCYDKDKRSERSDELFELLGKKSIGIETWPPNFEPKPGETLEESDVARFDELVREHCFRQAELFLRSLDRDDESSLPAIEILEYLLFQSRYVSESEYVVTGRIRDHLETFTGREITEQAVRSIIANLRDQNVIIASGPQGYKIPTRVGDVQQFARHANMIVPPMIGRLRRARNELSQTTLGELDVLAGDEFKYLRRIIDLDGQ